MKAAVYRRFGPPEVVRVEQTPKPSPGRDDVLVKVHASTVSVADHRARGREVPQGLWMLAVLGLGVFRPRNPVLGMDVAGVCSGVNKELVTSIGADRVIDYTTDNFTAEARTYDVIVDCVGNAPFERVEASINPGGALLLVIADLKGILRASRRSRRSGKLVTWSGGTYKAEDLAFLVSLAESGHYHAVCDRTYELSEIVEAHRFVDTGRKKGNVVVRVAASA